LTSAGEVFVFGYKGQAGKGQVHSHDVVVRAIEEFAANPRPGEVYNLGGGRGKQQFVTGGDRRIEHMTVRSGLAYVDEASKGDHICYIFESWEIRATSEVESNAGVGDDSRKKSLPHNVGN